MKPPLAHWIVCAAVTGICTSLSQLGLIFLAPSGGSWITLDFRFVPLACSAFFVPAFCAVATGGAWVARRRTLWLVVAYALALAAGVEAVRLAGDAGLIDDLARWPLHP